MFDLPTVCDDLARDFVGRTLPTGDPDVRVYIGSGILVPAFAVFAVLERDAVEALDHDRSSNPSVACVVRL